MEPKHLLTPFESHGCRAQDGLRHLFGPHSGPGARAGDGLLFWGQWHDRCLFGGLPHSQLCCEIYLRREPFPPPSFRCLRKKCAAALPGQARALLWTLFVALLGVTGTISVIIIWGAPQMVTLFAPRFVQEPEKFQLTVLMVRIMAPFLTLVSLAALFMGALNALPGILHAGSWPRECSMW